MTMRFRPFLLATAALLTLGAGETDPAGIAARSSGAFAAYLVGRAALQGSDFPTAAREFEQAMKDDPSEPELNNQAFLASLLAGQPQAIRLAATVPDSPLAVLALAGADGKAGHWAAAEARFAKLHTDQSVSQILQPLLIAWAEQGQDHIDAALAQLAPLADGSRFRGLYALHAGLIADLAGRAPDAERYFKIAAADYGQVNLRFAVILASWQARNGQMDVARRTIADLAAVDGEFGLSRQGLDASIKAPTVSNAAEGIAEAYLAIAATLRQQNNASAEAIVRLALEMRPDFTAAHLLLSDIEDASKRPALALAAIESVSPTDPLAPLVQLRRAGLLDETGQPAAAVSILQKLAAEHPERAEPWAQLGDLYRRQDQFADAVQAYNHAIDKLGVPSRANWPLFYARGIALERAGQWPRAEADLKYALELAPDQPSILNYLAYSWGERREHLDEAHAMLARAMAARPNEGAYVDSFGWVLLRQGETAAAISQLERAVELEPEDPTINGHLGDALAAAGRTREAEFQWRRALNLKPDGDEAKHLNAMLTALIVAPGPSAPK